MSELAKCRLCGGEATIDFDTLEVRCSNGACPFNDFITCSKEEWQKLNAPAPRVAELESQIERLELDLHLERKQNESLLHRIVDEKSKLFAAGEYRLGQTVYWSEKAIRYQSMECWQGMIDEELVVVGKSYGRLEQSGDVYYHVATKGDRDGGTDEIEESDLSELKPDEEYYRSFCS